MRRDVKQLWFPGVHGDVGGGYARADLSDGALGWMIEEANKLGLAFRDGIRDRLHPDALVVLHDSLTGVFRRLRTCPRAVPRVAADAPLLHASARQRFSGASFDHADYWASAALGGRGAPVACDVYARQPWNVSGLFLEAGTPYRFPPPANGSTARFPAARAGPRTGRSTSARSSSSPARVIDQTEDLSRKLSDDERAEFWGSRRVNGYPWFSPRRRRRQRRGWRAHETLPDRRRHDLTPRSAAAISTPTPTTPGPPTATTAAASA